MKIGIHGFAGHNETSCLLQNVVETGTARSGSAGICGTESRHGTNTVTYIAYIAFTSETDVVLTGNTTRKSHISESEIESSSLLVRTRYASASRDTAFPESENIVLC